MNSHYLSKVTHYITHYFALFNVHYTLHYITLENVMHCRALPLYKILYRALCITHYHYPRPDHNPARQANLLEALYQLVNKNAVEPVENQNSLGFYNRLFLVPKPNNRWRPILDLSTLNTFLNTESFKMETPETIRTSLQAKPVETYPGPEHLEHLFEHRDRSRWRPQRQ